MAKMTDIERKEVIELLEKAVLRKTTETAADCYSSVACLVVDANAFHQALALLQKPCEWRLNRELRRWETSCDVHSPINLDPSGTHINYCLNCGQPIKEIE